MEKRTIKVDVVQLLHILSQDKKRILVYSVVFGVVGLVIAFTTPKIYKSTVMLAPEESGAGFSSSISSLASMVGMNMKMGQTGDALYPEIYPDLVSSTDFLVGLFPVKVLTADGKVDCDYYTYLTKYQKTALIDYPKVGMGLLMKKLKSSNGKQGKTSGMKTPLWLTSDESLVAKGIGNNINCSVDKKTNVITITVTDQDPLVAALVADSVKEHLQIAITEYRTKKARVDLNYMQKLFDEAHLQYDKARVRYASYADANMDVSLQTYKSKEEDLENEMQLKYNIYQQVAEQLQLARAKVQERTPAFTVIQSANVPTKHSSRSKLLSMVLWMFLGFVVRSGWLTWKKRSLLLSI